MLGTKYGIYGNMASAVRLGEYYYPARPHRGVFMTELGTAILLNSWMLRMFVLY